MYGEETISLISARLRLAQQLLEESDRLPGQEGYNFGEKKWWFHPRHEREALVIYLLLTCIDNLGQGREFLTFGDWIRSKKATHTTEREGVFRGKTENVDGTTMALRLYDRYQSLYGIKNSFYGGLLGLPEQEKNNLLASVRLTFNPEYGAHGPNVSTPSKPLEDKTLELRLKQKYLYERRNRFTHGLDQFHSSSVPSLSKFGFENGSSWAAVIQDARITYMGVHQEHKILPTGGAYVFSISDWPFVLFESLYQAIGVAFDRTTIQLKFRVMVYSDDGSSVRTYDGVEHKYLKDCNDFLRIVQA